MTLARATYTALVCAALPLALVRLGWRARREAGYLEHVGERLGRYAAARDPRPVIWVHAVSVGETRAAEPLVHALLERYPDHQVLLTHMTPTGRRTGETVFGGSVARAYLPYDYPGAVSRFLEHFAPAVGILMETEIWPNLIHACGTRGIPVYLVNARLSEHSFRGYLRLASLARETLGRLTAVAAQAPADAKRLEALGARNVEVTGNLKFDVVPAAQQLELGRTFRADFGARRVLLAASTREGEEALLLDGLSDLPADVLLVIVPRHPQRFDDVAALLESRGLSYRRRSKGPAVAPDTRVLLGDSMGEMVAYYAASDLAYVGGSLLPFGGQNLIEACAVGTPVLVGPHTYNFAQAAAAAIEARAALRVDRAAALMQAASRLLDDPEALARMSARAREFSRAHHGATGRIMALIEVPGTEKRSVK
jgi:3-deoxy-D-manno-octulosonic-acid transferase